MNPDQTNQPQSEQTPLCRAITLLEQSAAPFDEACRILRELASGEAGMLVKLVPVRTLQDSINEWDELIASTDINAPVPAKQEEAPAPALQTVLHWFVFCEQNGIKVDMKTRAGQIPSNTILTEAQFCIEACLRYPLRAAHDQACTVPATEEAPAPGHNPDRLTIAQVGKGWRLLEEDEVDVFSRYNSPLDEIECRSLQHDCWGPGYNGANKSLSYRTRLSRAELRSARGLPPEPVPQDAAAHTDLVRWMHDYLNRHTVLTRQDTINFALSAIARERTRAQARTSPGEDVVRKIAIKHAERLANWGGYGHVSESFLGFFTEALTEFKRAAQNAGEGRKP